MDRTKFAQPVKQRNRRKSPSSIRWRPGLYERLQKHAALLANDRGSPVPVQTLINDILESVVDEWDKEIDIDTTIDSLEEETRESRV